MSNYYNCMKGWPSEYMIQVMLLPVQHYIHHVRGVFYSLDNSLDGEYITRTIISNIRFFFDWVQYASELIRNISRTLLLMIAIPLLALYLVDILVYGVRQTLNIARFQIRRSFLR